MANFNTHITVAALGSMTATAACIQKIGVSDQQALILFLLGSLGGMLPDIDLDHSIPAKWFFRILTFTGMLAVAMYCIPRFPLLHIAGYLLATFVLVHFILAKIIKSITVHRGLFHSVPAAGLLGMAMYFMGYDGFTWSQHFSWMAAAFISGGYLLHLALDELYSVDLLGGELKKSFGSALTLFNARQKLGYFILYSLLTCAVWYAFHPVPFTF